MAKQLDHWTGELNAFVMVLAFGLMVLDASCFAALRFTSDALTISGASARGLARPAQAANQILAPQ